MSGVYIKGMEMPQNCYGCCFFHQVNYWNKDNEADILSCCKRTGEKTFDDFIKYLPNCPLIPVPPHGRLIDGDALFDAFSTDNKPKSEWGYTPWYVAQGMTEEMPTIIPTDKEDE